MLFNPYVRCNEQEFFLNPEKNGADSSCRFREKRKKRIFNSVG